MRGVAGPGHGAVRVANRFYIYRGRANKTSTTGSGCTVATRTSASAAGCHSHPNPNPNGNAHLCAHPSPVRVPPSSAPRAGYEPPARIGISGSAAARTSCPTSDDRLLATIANAARWSTRRCAASGHRVVSVLAAAAVLVDLFWHARCVGAHAHAHAYVVCLHAVTGPGPCRRKLTCPAALVTAFARGAQNALAEAAAANAEG